MKKFTAILLLFSFLFAVDAEAERGDEILTGPKIQDREEVILSVGSIDEEKEEEKPEDADKKAEEAEEALARIKAQVQARARAEKEKEAVPPSSKLTPEEQQQVVELVVKVLVVLAILWLSQVVKTQQE